VNLEVQSISIEDSVAPHFDQLKEDLLTSIIHLSVFEFRSAKISQQRMFLLTGITLLLGLFLSARSQDGNRMNDLDRQISDLEQFLKSSDHLQQSRNDKASVWSNLGETWSSYYFGSGRS
jgi:hypothetical protein